MERNRAIKKGIPLAPQKPACRYCKTELDAESAFCPGCGRSKT